MDTPMRLAFGLVMALGLLAVPMGTSAATHAPQCPQRNLATGTVTIGELTTPSTLNPYQNGGDYIPSSMLFDGFIRYDRFDRVHADMLTEVPSVSNGGIRDGGRTVVLRLRLGMHWSDGAEITSSDIRFGWQIGRDGRTGPACAATCDAIGSIVLPDRYTASLHLKRPAAVLAWSFLPAVWPIAWPGSWKRGDVHAAANKLGQDPNFNFMDAGFPTNGPFEIASVDKGQSIALRPMPYYTTMACGARVARVVIRSFGSQSQVDQALEQHRIDLATTASTQLPNVHVRASPGAIIEHLELNHDKIYQHKPNPLANADVRLALALAIDKVSLVERALSVDSPTAHQLAASDFMLNKMVGAFPYSDISLKGQWDPIQKQFVQPGTLRALADAHTLLARTPFSRGFGLDFYTSANNPMRAIEARVIQEDWKRIGVTIQPEFVSTQELYGPGGEVDKGNFQVGMFAYAGGPDPDSWRYSQASGYISRLAEQPSALGQNFAGIRDPVIDRSYRAAEATFDPSVQRSQYLLIQQRMNQKAHWIPLHFRPSIVADTGRVQGFKGTFSDSWAWHVAQP